MKTSVGSSRRWARPTSVALVCTLGALLLTSCDLQRQRVLVWHDWPEPESTVLLDLLTSYSDITPDLQLIIEYVPDEEIAERFATEVRSGFGPDVVIGVDAGRLADLVDEGAVRRISSSQADLHGVDQLDARAAEAMSIDEELHGIPLAGFTDVLYFRDGVTPPETLDDILDLAEAGHPVGIPVEFFDAYWGVDAFNGTVFGNDEGLAPDAGFVRWMEWLVEARPHPNIIFNGDYATLRDLFAEGRIDLFVGGSRELGTFRSALQSLSGTDPDPADGDDESDAVAPTTPFTDLDDVTFGVATLPSGDNDEPGGFLDIEGMVANRYTDNLSEVLALMEFLTNAPSQGRIARSGVGRIPINESVSIDRTISPLEAALVDQQARALLLPRRYEDNQAELQALSNDIYLQVTSGLVEPETAPRLLSDRYLEILEGDGE